jgi:hypothetical protein
LLSLPARRFDPPLLILSKKEIECCETHATREH